MNDSDRRWLLLAMLFEAGLGGLAWALGWLCGIRVWESIRWQWRDAAVGIAASLPMLLGLVAIMRWPIGPLARLKQFAQDIIKPLFAPCTLLDLAALSIIAGFGEEMLFRGFLQAYLSEKFWPWVGVAAASLAFGLCHFITPTYVILAAMAGAYLSCVWLATDNLLAAIVAHALYDFLALAYLTRGADEKT